MTQPIVVAVHDDGTVEYTRNSALNDFFGGRGDMVRVTDIQKEQLGPLYYIKWLLGPFAGKDHVRAYARQYLTPDEILETLPVKMPYDACNDQDWRRLTFPAYEAAVAHEVQVLNAMRRKGVRFDAAP
jgi:hypothetical protein